MSIRPISLAVLLTMVVAAPSGAQESPLVKKPSEASKRADVALLGASVCAGFADVTSKGPDGKVNRTYRLDVPFKKVWNREIARVSNYGDLMMFMDPTKRGARQVQRAIKRQPDLVVAVDFMFWYGYGRMRTTAKTGEVQAERLALQAKGLAALAEFQCPVVVGDYPDASGASTKMLPKRMIPNKRTLAALNAKLKAWAAGRKNVHVFPIAKFVKEAVTVPQSYRWDDKRQVVLPPNFLLQSDRLHATRIGTLVIALRVAEFLPRILPRNSPLRKPRPTFRKLIEAVGLEAELPTFVPLGAVRPAPKGRAVADAPPSGSKGGAPR